MKKIYLLSLLVGVCFSIGFSQNQVIGIETWRPNEFGILSPSKKLSFDLDDAGNEVYNSLSFWSEWYQEIDVDNTYDLYSYTASTYNDAGQIVNKLYENVNRSYLYQRTSEYFYWGNCLNKSIQTLIIDEDETTQDITYYNSTTCQIDSIELFVHSSISDLLVLSNVKRYFYTGNNLQIILYGQDSLAGFTEMISYNEKTFDDEGRVLRSYASSTDIGPEERTYEYDQHGQVKYSSYSGNVFGNSDSLNLIQEHFYSHTYNSEEKLAQTIVTNWNHTGTTPAISFVEEINYEYHCDGLLYKKIYNTSLGGTQSTVIDYYQYQKGHDCELILESPELVVRPNVTTGAFLIESELLLAADSQISIYDMSGKRIQHHSVYESTDRYYLNINGLPTGFYIVHVARGDQQVSKRVAKL